VRRFPLAAVGLLIAVAAPLTAQQEPEVPDWAKDQLRVWYEAFSAGDAAGMARQYATDAVLLPPGEDPVRGREAIEAFNQAAMANTDFSCTGTYDGFQIMGAIAAGWGHDLENCTATPKSGGPSEEIGGRWLAFYERQADGSWLIIRDTWQD
jgi:uncharacterized protein (TIGR02246 family)